MMTGYYLTLEFLISQTMKQLILFTIFLSSISNLKSQDVIYTVSGTYNQKKIPLDSIVIENLTNGKIFSFKDLPTGDNYLINLTQNTLGNTVNTTAPTKPQGFRIYKNIPGEISLIYNGLGQTDARISLVNINGQIIETYTKKHIYPGILLRLRFGGQGLYFLRIESNLQTQTYKIYGQDNFSYIKIDIVEEINSYIQDIYPKNAVIIGENHFSYEQGDSIRIWTFKKGLFSWPRMFRINISEGINFTFNEIVNPILSEIAYQDSIGEIIPFLIDGDTMYCKKVNNEYVFQGDILITKESLYNDSLKGAYVPTNLYPDPFILIIGQTWPNGKIFYEVDNSMKDDERLKNAILYWNENCPVTFIRRDKETKYVTFKYHKENCASHIGMQPLNFLNTIFIPDWANYGHILHEMGHTAGLIHEHSRSDRNDHIIVYPRCYVMDDINYHRFPSSINYGKFDFESIMLYKTSFKNDGKNCPDMTKIDGSEIQVQRSYLSFWDIKTLELMYGSRNSLKPIIDIIDNGQGKSWEITGIIKENGYGNIIDRVLAWKKAGDLNYNYKHFGAGSTDFSISLSNLSCGEYFCYATATNNDGSSTSRVIGHYIPPDIEFSITDITSNSALMNININDGESSCVEKVVYWLFRNLEEAQNHKVGEAFIKSSKLELNNNLLSTTITGLSPGTTYYVRVILIPDFVETGAIDDDIIEFTTPEISIGQYHAGGIVFYIDDSGLHGLAAAKIDHYRSVPWYNGEFVKTGATGKEIGIGLENTRKIIAALGDGDYAASNCYKLVSDGYSDWFLPSQNELDAMFKHYEILGMEKSSKYWSSTDGGCTTGGIWGGCAYCRDGWGYNSYEGPSSKHNVRAIRTF